MKYIQTVKVSDKQTMAIYELSDGRFALTCSPLSDYYLERKSEKEIIECLKECSYEGVFQTEKEAYLTAKLVAASCELDRLKDKIEAIKKLQVKDLIW